MGTTVEHVKQLRDDITLTTANSFRESFRESGKMVDDRAARLEARMSSLEIHLAKIAALLENGNTYNAGGGSGSGSGSGITTARATSSSNNTSGYRSGGSQLGASQHRGGGE